MHTIQRLQGKQTKCFWPWLKLDSSRIYLASIAWKEVIKTRVVCFVWYWPDLLLRKYMVIKWMKWGVERMKSTSFLKVKQMLCENPCFICMDSLQLICDSSSYCSSAHSFIQWVFLKCSP
jgi:hypothetical protein